MGPQAETPLVQDLQLTAQQPESWAQSHRPHVAVCCLALPTGSCVQLCLCAPMKQLLGVAQQPLGCRQQYPRRGHVPQQTAAREVNKVGLCSSRHSTAVLQLCCTLVTALPCSEPTAWPGSAVTAWPGSAMTAWPGSAVTARRDSGLTELTYSAVCGALQQ